MDDFKFELYEVRDEPKLERDGRTVTPQKFVRFGLGKHGPFTEKLPADGWNDELQRRVAKLQAELQAIPR